MILTLTKLSILQYLFYRLSSLSFVANSMLCYVSQPRPFILNTKRLKIEGRDNSFNTYIKLHPIVIRGSFSTSFTHKLDLRTQTNHEDQKALASDFTSSSDSTSASHQRPTLCLDTTRSWLHLACPQDGPMAVLLAKVASALPHKPRQSKSRQPIPFIILATGLIILTNILTSVVVRPAHMDISA